MIDIDGDGSEEIFVGGGEGQSDVVLRYDSGRLAVLPDSHGLSSLAAAHGVTAIDMDADTDADLLVARTDGIYLYLNQNGEFTGRMTDQTSTLFFGLGGHAKCSFISSVSCLRRTLQVVEYLYIQTEELICAVV